MDLEPIEEAVLRKLLAGEHPALVTLREQLDGMRVVDRRQTGVGFFTTFQVADARPRLRRGGAPFGDVEATISGLFHGAGFLLWLEAGKLHRLEGYTYDEPWPNPVGEFTLKYADPSRKALWSQLDALT